MADDRYRLSNAYKLSNTDETHEFYQGWAAGYEAEIIANGYATPQRCASRAQTFW